MAMTGAWARRIAVFQRSLRLIAILLRTKVRHWPIADRLRSCGTGPRATVDRRVEDVCFRLIAASA